ncbi:XPC-binding domain-containing protein [Thamnocephalis sphaerospora]|uniref:UV excision repair protein RAD23 n=1 Tax=Thamnocephalis sphaerospora TaxID=78915 RepID=A0A4P9XK95_9FUNG|nr:XPC-binding domain-containing protein [Thamnocephalis sphaerospora]|eukprot:RKP06185.1 XPC-binding domain-containing protein [Thamnocephalis sphaerospora]
MKLTFKTLQQEQFHLEVDLEETVRDVKRKISQERGYDEAAQKLIYSGKVLVDDKALKEYGVTENGFVVVMVTKASAAAKKPAAAQAGASSSVAATAAGSAAAPAAPVPAAAAPASAATAPAVSTETSAAVPATAEATSYNANEALVTGAQFEQAVQNMVEMGFSHADVMRAMRASFNNPDRAVEYLMTGIPEGLDAAPATEAAAPPTAATGGDTAAPESTGDLSFLRSNPHFQQLRQTVQQNPALLQPLLAQLAHANPRLMQAIEENQQAFMQLLLEGVEDDDEEGAEGHEEGAMGGQPGVHYINVTQEEKDAIDRLVAMGFDRAEAIEAYLACDKNEEMAANFLFDNMNDL